MAEQVNVGHVGQDAGQAGNGDMDIGPIEQPRVLVDPQPLHVRLHDCTESLRDVCEFVRGMKKKRASRQLSINLSECLRGFIDLATDCGLQVSAAAEAGKLLTLFADAPYGAGSHEKTPGRLIQRLRPVTNSYLKAIQDHLSEIGGAFRAAQQAQNARPGRPGRRYGF